MKTLLGAILAIGLLLTVAPRGAWAVDGTITALSFSPATGTPNQNVTITVQGTLKCKKLNVNFGDNSPVVTLDNADFENNNQADNSATHVYTSAGSYTVTATAVEQCTGAAQKIFTVTAGGAGTGMIQPGLAENLCKILDNCPKFQIGKAMGQTLMVFPRIEALFPFSVPEPGGDILVFGKNFGNAPGELHL
ncbi:MAG: hypothetical protein Q8R92_11735, partial [Deltaproteobacteria bacterium]|nr:hypothetical protein [Deltaproteobacteria bacterium]